MHILPRVNCRLLYLYLLLIAIITPSKAKFGTNAIDHDFISLIRSLYIVSIRYLADPLSDDAWYPNVCLTFTLMRKLTIRYYAWYRSKHIEIMITSK